MMASEDDFDFSAQILMAGSATAERNWERLKEHTVAEWSGDLHATMETMTRNDPFQIMYPTGMNIRGWENVREFYRARMKVFSGQGFFAHQWVVSDKLIVGQGYFSGAPTGMFFGTPAHGKQLLVPTTVWVYFEDTLVKGEAAYLDGLELQRQIREGAPPGRTIKTPLV
jgi:predicted ester cyclase